MNLVAVRDKVVQRRRFHLGFAGLPTTVTPSATSRITVDPAPTTALLPMVRLGMTVDPAQTKVPAPTRTVPHRVVPGAMCNHDVQL